MKAVKITVTIVVAALLAWMAGCKGESKYATDIEIINKLTGMAEKLLKDADKAPNPLAFRDAIAGFNEAYKAIKPEITAFEKKYPNFKIKDGEKGAPKELKPLIKRFYNALSRSRIIIEAKVNKFKRFSGVIIAYKEFKEIVYYY